MSQYLHKHKITSGLLKNLNMQTIVFKDKSQNFLRCEKQNKTK